MFTDKGHVVDTYSSPGSSYMDLVILDIVMGSPRVPGWVTRRPGAGHHVSRGGASGDPIVRFRQKCV